MSFIVYILIVYVNQYIFLHILITQQIIISLEVQRKYITTTYTCFYL